MVDTEIFPSFFFKSEGLTKVAEIKILNNVSKHPSNLLNLTNH